MKWMVTGDIHGDLDRFDSFFDSYEGDPADIAIIILGDAGFNYYMRNRDNYTKEKACRYGCKFYCVRGNHEARPIDVKGMTIAFDEEIESYVYMQPEYPNIRYFVDGDTCHINGLKTLIIGGAYSVDKEYRQLMHWSWFANEQLTTDELAEIENECAGENYDMVLTHTCPYSWEPRDLFLSFIDQSKVDETMEKWMESFKDKITYKAWLCGHFHANRELAPNAFMLYGEIHNVDEFIK